MKPSKWFVIVNPKAGNGSALKQWPKIEVALLTNDFNFEFAFTQKTKRASQLVIDAVTKGYKNIICVGGDGTLHAVVNGIMLLNTTETSSITVGLIPIGSGNDWAKSYAIPINVLDAIQLIKKNRIKTQDVGKIDFLESKNTSVYFNNLAGIGFDGLVAKKAEKLKHFGKLAYLIASFQSLISFKNFEVELLYNGKCIKSKSLMVLVGLCSYSGGGMRLTHLPNPEDGLFDISNVTNFNSLDLIVNLTKLYNNKVNTVKKVKTFKTSSLVVNTLKKSKAIYIQADGEVLQAESIRVTIIKKAFSFYY